MTEATGEYRNLSTRISKLSKFHMFSKSHVERCGFAV